MEIKDMPKITWTNYVDIREGKLVLVSRKISEGYYDLPQVIDNIVGSVLDIVA